MTKVLLSVGVYLCVVFLLGLFLALTAPRQGFEQDLPDNKA